jgi:periplasmic protein TonB
MKRLLLAMLLALAGHALLFWWGRDLAWMPAEIEGPRHQVPLHLELVAQPATEPEPPTPPPAASPTPPRPVPETASQIRPESFKAAVAEPAPEPEPPPMPPRPEREPEPAAKPEPEFPPQPATPAAAPAAPAPAPPRDPGPMAAAEETAEIIMARPLYRENPPPPYPPAARQRFYQGTVLLAVLVNEQGRVEEMEVATSSGHPLLDRAALKGVRDWRFEPGRRNGQAVAMWVQVPIRFAIE